MTDQQDNWDTNAANPYVSEYILPINNRESGKEYTYWDVCQETFALMLWKLQEEYHLDYETAFLLGGNWRILETNRLTILFGKDGEIIDRSLPDLRKAHPEVREIEKVLPKRNLPRIRPIDNYWMEEDKHH